MQSISPPNKTQILSPYTFIDCSIEVGLSPLGYFNHVFLFSLLLLGSYFDKVGPSRSFFQEIWPNPLVRFDLILLLYKSVTKHLRKFRFLNELMARGGGESPQFMNTKYQVLSIHVLERRNTKLSKWRVEFTKRKSQEFIFGRGNSVSKLRRVKTWPRLTSIQNCGLQTNIRFLFTALLSNGFYLLTTSVKFRTIVWCQKLITHCDN